MSWQQLVSGSVSSLCCTGKVKPTPLAHAPSPNLATSEVASSGWKVRTQLGKGTKLCVSQGWLPAQACPAAASPASTALL